MARPRTSEIGWTDADGDDYRVTLEYEPGSEGCAYEPPTGPEVTVVRVVEDFPGGAERPDLIAVVEAELDGPLYDRVCDRIEDGERDRFAAAMEDRADAARDERLIARAERHVSAFLTKTL